jgi:hypothetical protein
VSESLVVAKPDRSLPYLCMHPQGGGQFDKCIRLLEGGVERASMRSTRAHLAQNDALIASRFREPRSNGLGYTAGDLSGV